MINSIPFIKKEMVKMGIINKIPMKNILMSNSGISLDKFYCKFIAPDEHIGMMCFPTVAKNNSGRRSQQMNYDCFISTMAELMKKYASKGGGVNGRVLRQPER